MEQEPVDEEKDENLYDSPRKKQAKGSPDVPYYLRNFKIVLSHVLNNAHNRTLFPPEELQQVDFFRDLSDLSQQLYVRLFLRQRKWMPKTRIAYPKIAADLTPVLDDMVHNALLLDEKSLNDLPFLLDLLQLAQLRQLCKDLNISSSSSVNAKMAANKPALVQALMRHARQYRPLFGTAPSSEIAVLKKVKAMIGPCYSLAPEPDRVFHKCVLLFVQESSLVDKEDETLEAQQIIYRMFEVDIGRTTFPDYSIIVTKPLFPSSEEFDRFCIAHKHKTECQKAVKSGDLLTVITVASYAMSALKKLFTSPRVSDHDMRVACKESIAFPDSKVSPLRSNIAVSVGCPSFESAVGGNEGLQKFCEVEAVFGTILKEERERLKKDAEGKVETTSSKQGIVGGIAIQQDSPASKHHRPQPEQNRPQSERNRPQSERNRPQSERNRPQSERNRHKLKGTSEDGTVATSTLACDVIVLSDSDDNEPSLPAAKRSKGDTPSVQLDLHTEPSNLGSLEISISSPSHKTALNLSLKEKPEHKSGSSHVSISPVSKPASRSHRKVRNVTSRPQGIGQRNSPKQPKPSLLQTSLKTAFAFSPKPSISMNSGMTEILSESVSATECKSSSLSIKKLNVQKEKRKNRKEEEQEICEGEEKVEFYSNRRPASHHSSPPEMPPEQLCSSTGSPVCFPPSGKKRLRLSLKKLSIPEPHQSSSKKIERSLEVKETPTLASSKESGLRKREILSTSASGSCQLDSKVANSNITIDLLGEEVIPRGTSTSSESASDFPQSSSLKYRLRSHKSGKMPCTSQESVTPGRSTIGKGRRKRPASPSSRSPDQFTSSLSTRSTDNSRVTRSLNRKIESRQDGRQMFAFDLSGECEFSTSDLLSTSETMETEQLRTLRRSTRNAPGIKNPMKDLSFSFSAEISNTADSEGETEDEVVSCDTSQRSSWVISSDSCASDLEYLPSPVNRELGAMGRKNAVKGSRCLSEDKDAFRQETICLEQNGQIVVQDNRHVAQDEKQAREKPPKSVMTVEESFSGTAKNSQSSTVVRSSKRNSVSPRNKVAKRLFIGENSTQLSSDHFLLSKVETQPQLMAAVMSLRLPSSPPRQPSSSPQQPSSSPRQPSSSPRQPTPSPRQPSSSPQQPSSSPRQPASSPRQPSSFPRQPSSSPRQPSSSPRQPSSSPQQPSSSPQQPAPSPRQPSSFPRQPSSSPRQPSSSPRQPSSSPRQPSSSPQQPTAPLRKLSVIPSPLPMDTSPVPNPLAQSGTISKGNLDGIAQKGSIVPASMDCTPFKVYTSLGPNVEVLSLAVEVLEKKRLYKEACTLLHFLVKCPGLGQSRRGHWFERLALNLDFHLKKHGESLLVIEEGMKDLSLHPARKYSLLQRGQKIQSTKGGKVSPMALHLPDIHVHPYKENVVLARNHPRKNQASYALFVKPTYSPGATIATEDFEMVSVEQLCLHHYQNVEGWTRGVHCEGAAFSTMFALLFWDILFFYDVPDVFRSRFQHLPMDFNSEAFYSNRKTAIDQKLEWIKMATSEVLAAEVEKLWTQYYEERCGLVSWGMLTCAEDIKSLAMSLGPDLLCRVCTLYATRKHSHFRSGLPDLLLWKPESFECKFVEVKGPQDRLSAKQILWLSRLCEWGYSAEVCRVRVT